MYPARQLTDWIMGRLEARAAAIVALSNESFALVREDGLRLNPVDHEVLRMQLAQANRLLLVLLCSFDERSDDDDTDATVEAARVKSVRYRPALAPDDDRRRYLISLITNAHERTLRLRRLLSRMRAGDKIRAALGRAALHLELALLVLGVERRIETRNATERVQLASTREQLELTVEEYRDVVRGHRDDGGWTTADV